MADSIEVNDIAYELRNIVKNIDNEENDLEIISANIKNLAFQLENLSWDLEDTGAYQEPEYFSDYRSEQLALYIEKAIISKMYERNDFRKLWDNYIFVDKHTIKENLHESIIDVLESTDHYRNFIDL